MKEFQLNTSQNIEYTCAQLITEYHLSTQPLDDLQDAKSVMLEAKKELVATDFMDKCPDNLSDLQMKKDESEIRYHTLKSDEATRRLETFMPYVNKIIQNMIGEIDDHTSSQITQPTSTLESTPQTTDAHA